MKYVILFILLSSCSSLLQNKEDHCKKEMDAYCNNYDTSLGEERQEQALCKIGVYHECMQK